MLASLLLALPILGGAQGGDPSAPGPPAVELVHLANEGFLIRDGDDAILIDAFLAQPYVGYAAVAPAVLDQLLAAEAPFDSVDIALASHVHADHFQAGPACAFLEASPDTFFASSADVVGALRKECADLAGSEAQVREVLPKPGESEVLRMGELSVEVLRISHGTGRFAEIQNLGHVLTIGGMRVLHVGDAAMNPKNFAPYGLAARDLDVALVPYWYFGDEAGMGIVQEHFHADTLVACHIPPRELEAVTAALATNFPDVLVFRESLESRRIERAPGAATDD